MSADASSADGPAPGAEGWAPGQVFCAAGSIELNEGAPRTTLRVRNTGDRPVQVGSHFHLASANAALELDRAAAHGLRLDIPAGTAVRFEPGLARDVTLVPLRGARVVPGLSLPAPGPLDSGPLDSGPLDSGPLDSGPLDPGPLDPGPLDPGPLDPGPLDPSPSRDPSPQED